MGILFQWDGEGGLVCWNMQSGWNEGKSGPEGSRLTPNSSCEWPNGWNGCCWMAGHSCLTRAEAPPPSYPYSSSTCQFPLNGCWEKGSRLSGTIKSLGVHHLSARRIEPASFSASCQFISDFRESWQVGDSFRKVLTLLLGGDVFGGSVYICQFTKNSKKKIWTVDVSREGEGREGVQWKFCWKMLPFLTADVQLWMEKRTK